MRRLVSSGMTFRDARGLASDMVWLVGRDTDEAIDLTFHAYGRSEGVCGIIISDHAYPALVAHQLLSKIVDEFLEANPRSSWSTGSPTIAMPQLKEYIEKYQVSSIPL